MPTIDELPTAVSVSDRDELVVSQSDIARKATRAQLVAGLQPTIAIPANTLLGRVSAGTGSPETLAIGANLTVGNGVISAPAPFVIATLPTGGAPMPTDPVPIGQGGQNSAISYATFLGGVSELTGLDASNFVVRATGTTLARRLSDSLSDALTVESFGAVGDGVTDDTNAFVQAAASGRPLRLDARVYIINGGLVLDRTAALIGVAQSTVIRRTTITPLANWIEISASVFDGYGVQFDAGGLLGVDTPAVMVSETCQSAHFLACGFSNATGSVTGSGLSVVMASTATHQVLDCYFSNNALHGCFATGGGTITVLDSLAQGNISCGFRVDAGIACQLHGLCCNGNDIGISIGNWSNAASTSGTFLACVVSGSTCSGNAQWGIAVAGTGAQITGNTVQDNGATSQGGGMLARLGASRLAANLTIGGHCGLDVRGCWGSLISANHVSDAVIGMMAGGSQYMAIAGNTLLTNTWALALSAIEPTLSLQPTGPVTIRDNWIGFTAAQGGGVFVQDGAQGIAITGNDINGWGSASVSQALWLHTDAALVRGNRWNNQGRPSLQSGIVSGREALVVADVADEALVTSAPSPIASILTSHQADTLGQLGFIKVLTGGSGYSQASVTISGSGTGAAATAYVASGRVVWIVVTNPGSGYGPIGTAIMVTVAGDGSGAAATASAGLPVLEGRSLRLHCNCQVKLSLSGSSPTQQSWTGFDTTIPAYGALDLEGVSGSWRAEMFPPVDYVAPTGDGGAILQSIDGGSLTLRPASGGSLRIANAGEPTGCTSTVGRGSPIGSVAAPPGSDFRNLDGGPGNTFWIKQANSDATGWLAIA